VEAALDGSDEKQGTDPVALDVRGMVDAFDVLIVSSGRNDRQVRAIAEEIERRIKLATGLSPTHTEGLDSCEWVALDYGFAIVHVFDDAHREYYDLEHLWSGSFTTRRRQDTSRVL
jgi:ribosome-associated protein